VTRLRTLILPAVIAAIVVGVGIVLSGKGPPAPWLRVDAPGAMSVGRPFVATVTLLEPLDGLFLNFDLHGLDARRNPLHCVVAGPSEAVVAGKSTYAFTLVLSERPDVDRVHAVVFLSRTGRWGDMVRVARSESFPVVRGASDHASGRVAPLAVYDPAKEPVIDVPNPPAARALIALIWLVGAVTAGVTWRRTPASRTAPALVVLCIFLVFWEGMAAGAWIEAASRAAARSSGVYQLRQTFQQFATLVVVLAVGVGAAVGLRRRRRSMSTLILSGLALYGAVTVAGMLSFHEIDRVLAFSCGGAPMAVVLRGLGSGLATAGLIHRLTGARAIQTD